MPVTRQQIKMTTEKVEKDQTSMSSGEREIMGIEHTIPIFQGDTGMSIKMWFENFECNAVVYKWSEQQKYVFARSRMRKAAQLFIESVSVCDYKTLKKLLMDEFQKQYSSAEIHAKLQERRKLETESMYEYILHMRQIGYLGNVDEGSIIKYIVDGINDRNENKITLYGAKSYAELREKYEIYDRIFRNNKQVGYNRKNNAIKTKVTYCFNCGSKDHKRSECQNDQKCFNCNKSGHISKFCTEKRDVNCTWSNETQKEVQIDGKKFQCLIDGGANISIMRDDVFTTNFEKQCLQKCDVEIRGLGGSVVVPVGMFRCKIRLDGIEVDHKMAVVPENSIKYEVIVGFDVLRMYRYTSDERGYVFHSIIESHQTEIRQLMNVEIDDEEDLNIPDEIRKKIDNLEANYKLKSNPVSPVQMKVVLEKEDPIYTTPSRLPIAEQNVVDMQIQEWLGQGIIKKSSSPYCSRVVLTGKKDGSKRVCVDYRRINKVTLKDRFPVPNMEDVLDSLAESCIYSVLDIKNAFFHVPIEESSKKFLAFTTKTGLFEFNYAPFGFCNSPANFIRFINVIFQDLINKNILQIYVDDIIIFSNDYESGLTKLENVLEVAAENGLVINWKKSNFLKKRVEFLGFIVENGTIKPNIEKVAAIKRFPQPRNVKELQSFLGLIGFFRKFVKNFSVVAKPLTNMLKKDAEFKMGPEEKIAINALKECLATQPVLRIFSMQANTELHTDASKEGFGAILMQEHNGKWHAVYYYSKKTTEAESKLHSYHLEMKAAYMAMKKLRHYLLGLKFTLVTDCAALKYLSTKEHVSPFISRYVMYMQDFDFEVKHRRAEQMKHVDALSRYMVMTISAETETKSRLIKAQDGDEGIKAIKGLLRNGSYDNYSIVGGVLCKEVNGVKMMVAPRHMEKEIITKAHQNGHFSFNKTCHMIKQQYFIPHLEGKVKKIIANCVQCILHNKKSGKQEGFLNCIDKGEQPLSTLHVDHLGPLDATAKLYKHIFAVVDGFSKFIWLYPTKTSGVEEVVSRLESWRAIFGNPGRIISDKGPAFTSKIFEEFCKKNEIEHVKTTTGVPRGNGQIERVNKTILSVVAKLSSEKPEKWYQYVNDVQRAINSNLHRSLKYTPFEILFGIKMKNENVNNDILKIIENGMVEELDNERQEMREEAKAQIVKVQAEYKNTFDKRRKEGRSYEEGDLVAIKRTQYIAGKKLASEYLGPYEIVKVKRAGRYDVLKKGDTEGPIKTSTAIDQMKPWREEDEEDVSSGSDEEKSDGRM